MHIICRLVLALSVVVFSCGSVTASGKKHASSKKAKKGPDIMEAATRLQVFLDRANFSPGKLDGYYGDFTVKALAFYRQSRGEQVAMPSGKQTAPPDVTGLDLASVEPVFINYTVTDADLQTVGELPDDVAAKAKLKVLPYHDAAEAIGEKFHSDPDFLEKLNPGKMKTIKVGDQIRVPNVEPFELAAVKSLKPGSEIARRAANDMPAEDTVAAQQSGADLPAGGDQTAAGVVSVDVDTKTNMLTVHQGDAIVAAYPVTIGSAQTESPLGQWKVSGVATMPDYRYDEKMLNEGQRSDDFKMLAPGPNNPVGVTWIALNKKGVGLHGTDNPDLVGRSASHGCVRLANWDVVRLAGKVKGGVPVSIH